MNAGPGHLDDIAKTSNGQRLGWPLSDHSLLVTHVVIGNPAGLLTNGAVELRFLVVCYSRLMSRRSTYQNMVISELKSATAAATWLPMG